MNRQERTARRQTRAQMITIFRKVPLDSSELAKKELRTFLDEAKAKSYVVASGPGLYFPDFKWGGGPAAAQGKAPVPSLGPAVGLLVGSNTILVKILNTKKTYPIGESLLSNLVSSGRIKASRVDFE